MPTPPRRRPATGPSGRRPRVAGLRRPTADPRPEQAEPIEDTPAETGPIDTGPVETTPDEATQTETTPTEDTPTGTDREETAAEQAPPADLPEQADEPDPVPAGGVIGAPPTEKSDEAHDSSEGVEEVPAPRPAPTGKRRSGSRAVPADLRSAERSAGGPTRVKSESDPVRRALNLAVVLAVAALIAAALGFYFKGQADRLTAGADRANSAFADPAATAEVKSKIISALERALSYDYRDLDKTAAAVREVLSGRAVCEYDAMFGQLKELAPAQKLVHTTIVRELGVRSLSADRAEALVFIDQTSTRVEEDQTTASGAQLGVTAERVDGQWRIVAFNTFDQPLPNGRPLPQC